MGYKIMDNNTAKYFSKKELWLNQAPSFNFELNADQLLKKALSVGFVSKVSDDKYLLNDSYVEGGE